ncbi:MAG: LPS assembly lipoprotein LptE [Nitrospinota bacterium]|nr:LPS assembly lipoprotein LptE [Nitrospinota bacterium]
MVGQATGLPEEIRTVAVDVFENDTFEPNIEAPITRGIIQKLNQDGRLKVVPQQMADCVISGTITGYSISPISYDSHTGSVTGYLNSISVSFNLRDVRSHGINYSSSVSTNGSYAVAAQHASTESSRMTSIESMGTSIGSSMVSILLNQYPSTPEIHGDLRKISPLHIRNLRSLYEWRPQDRTIYGNTEGVDIEIIQKLEQLYAAKVPSGMVVNENTAVHLINIAKKINRETGIFITSDGTVTHVAVGTASGILPPWIPSRPTGEKPLAGYRFIQTNIGSGGLTKEYIEKFSFLGLDVFASVRPLAEGGTANVSFAYPDPKDKTKYVLLHKKTFSEIDGIYRSIYPLAKPKKENKVAIHGSLQGIGNAEKEKLESIQLSNVPAGKPFLPQTAFILSEISKKYKKEVGYLVDRNGNITDIMLGDENGFPIPDIPDIKVGDMGLSGYRLIKTQFDGKGVDDKSLSALLEKRLDALITIHISPDEEADKLYLSHFSLKNFTPLITIGPLTGSELEKRYSILHKRMMEGVSRKIPVTDETLRLMTRLSHQLSIRLGVLIDRENNITHLIAGDEKRILIPEIPLKRVGNLQLSGYRLIRTGAVGEGITTNDLVDLNFLRLDAVIVVEQFPDGTPGKLFMAHLTSDKESPVSVSGPRNFEENEKYYQSIVWKLEEPEFVKKITGDTGDLDDGQIKKLEDLYEFKLPPGIPATAEIVSVLTSLTKSLKRQAGVLVDREGKIIEVIAGTKESIIYPEVRQLQLGHLDLSGSTFIHTYIDDAKITEDIIQKELLMKRYDGIVMINTDSNGKAGNISLAHIPEQKTDAPFVLIGPADIEEVAAAYIAFTRRFEWQLESFWSLGTGWRLEATTKPLDKKKQ